MQTHCTIFCKRADLKRDKLTLFSHILYNYILFNIPLDLLQLTYFTAAIKLVIPENRFRTNKAKSSLEFLTALRAGF
jgi:hypothetical protein